MRDSGVWKWLQRGKHGVFVAKKHASWKATEAKVALEDLRGRLLERNGPAYEYSPGRYPRTFLERTEPPHLEGLPCPRVIYTIWFGDNMPARRRAALDQLRQANPRTPVVLVTEDNLADYLVAGHPLHPAFDDMSPVHQSDHVRCYLMNFHGGGYSDLKPPTSSWEPAFDHMDANERTMVMGYREVTSTFTSEHPRNLGVDLRRYYRFLIGPSAFIMRPQSLFTASFFREQNRRMDYCAPAFTDLPITDAYHLPASYPLWWGELMGDITHCLSLRYQDRVQFDERIRPVLEDYR